MREEVQKICFISASLEGGGMERALTALANYAAEKKHRVTILTLFQSEVFFDLHPSIQVIQPEIGRKRYHRMLYAALLLPYVRSSLKRIQPDTVLSFGEWFNSYVLLASRFLPYPVFVSDRMGPDMYMGKLLETARSYTYRFAAGIIAQTEVAAQRIRQKTGANRIKVIPNAVSPISTNPAIKKRKQIVTVGRLSREKGHSLLLQAFAGLAAPDWELHLVGDGNERVKLESLAGELNIEQKVVFHGHLKDFSSILAASSIFVLPSLYEGFPNALLEAMSVPLPCISFDCVAGPSDIIVHGKNGLLVAPENTAALAKAIEELMLDREKREALSKEAFKVRETFAFEPLADQYLDYLLA